MRLTLFKGISPRLLTRIEKAGVRKALLVLRFYTLILELSYEKLVFFTGIHQLRPPEYEAPAYGLAQSRERPTALCQPTSFSDAAEEEIDGVKTAEILTVFLISS